MTIIDRHIPDKMKNDDKDAKLLSRDKQVDQGTCNTTNDSNKINSVRNQYKANGRSLEFSLLNQNHWQRLPLDSDSEKPRLKRERRDRATEILSKASSSLLLEKELQVCENKLISKGRATGATRRDSKNGKASNQSKLKKIENGVGEPESSKRIKYTQAASPLSGAPENAEDRLRKQYESELYALRLQHGPDDSRLCDSLCRLGLFHQHISRDLDQALFCHKDALRILRNESSECTSNAILKAIGIILVDIGRISECKGEYQVAKDNYEEALTLFQDASLPETDLQIYSCKQGLHRCR